MDSKDLIQILKSDPLKFTFEEIEQMMDEELEKDPAEMDTDFIDLCADTLNKALEANKENTSVHNEDGKKRIKIKIIRAIVIAAVMAAIIGMAIPVAAKYIDNDTSDKIVQFYEDHFSINLRNSETDADKYSDENFITALVDFKNTVDEPVIGVTITKHKNGIDTVLNNDKQVTSEYDSAKQLNINEVVILVFGNKENSTITYIDDHTEYAIDLTNTDFNSAIEIAESIQ